MCWRAHLHPLGGRRDDGRLPERADGEYDYNPNYRITVMPGTFTIGDAVLTRASASRTPHGHDATTPLGGSIQTVYRTAAAADRLARAVAGTDDISEPVYAEVLFDDSTPMVSRVGGETIEDDATALGASTSRSAGSTG